MNLTKIQEKTVRKVIGTYLSEEYTEQAMDVIESVLSLMPQREKESRYGVTPVKEWLPRKEGEYLAKCKSENQNGGFIYKVLYWLPDEKVHLDFHKTNEVTTYSQQRGWYEDGRRNATNYTDKVVGWALLPEDE